MLVAVHPGPATSLSLGQSFAAGRGTITVGRLEQNVLSATQMSMAAGVQLPEKLVNMVSRQHARLEVVAGHLQLVDLGAVNGTYVNGQRLEGGSTRVLQEGDVVSFGGPISIVLRGEARPNPWVWRVRDLQQFLAAFVPPGQEPPSAGASPASAAGAGQLEPPPREVFRFSPGPPVAGGVPQQQLALPAAVEAEEEVVSPAPARGGHAQPGSMPVGVRPLPAPAAAGEAAGAGGEAADDSDDSAALDLAALEAYIATQQAANPAAGGGAAAQAGTAAQPAAPAPLLPDDAHLQGATQQAGAQMLPASSLLRGSTQVLPPGAMPVQGAAQQAATQVLPLGAMPVQAAARALPPGAMPVHGATQAAAAAPPAAPPGPAAQQPALQAAPRPPPQPELVDLTADSPSPVSAGRQRAGLPPLGGAAGGLGGSGAAPAAPALAAAPAAVQGMEVVDLSSPTKRRHGPAEQEAQEAKRARPSPEAHLQPGGNPEASAAAAAAAVGPEAATAAAAAPDLTSMHQELMCAICQEMLVATHNMYPCNHPFCGECLAGWLGKGKRECPTCRVKGTAAPVRAHQMDNIIAMIAKSLPPEDQESRQEKLQSWEANKERLERELAASWAGGSGGSGRDRGAGSGSRHGGGGGGADLYGLAAAILGGGGPLAALGAPLFLGGGPGYGDPHDFLAGAPLGGGSGNRRGAAPPRRAAPPPPIPPRHDFRVEVSPQLSTARCATCGNAIGEHTTRIGMRQAGATRRGGSGYQWHHLACLPAVHFREATERGVEGLRSIPARDQAYVRERMRPPR